MLRPRALNLESVSADRVPCVARSKDVHAVALLVLPMIALYSTLYSQMMHIEHERISFNSGRHGLGE